MVVLRTSAPKRVLVVGSGAIGLRTALELRRREIQVVLRAPVSPLTDSCSMGAGGLWMPYQCADPRVDSWALTTLNELYKFAESRPDLAEVVPTILLRRDHAGPNVDDFNDQDYKATPQTETFPAWTRDPRLAFQHLTVEMLSWQNIVHRLKIPPEQELKEAGYLHAWFFRPPIANAPNLLQYLLDELEEEDINVETGEYYQNLEDLQETAANLNCDAVVNCTGLGAARLVPGEDQLVPGRGVIFQYDRDECHRRPAVLESPYGNNVHDAVLLADEEPWGSNTHPAYLIVRGQTVVVGGTYLEKDTETTIREEEREKLLLNAECLGIDVTRATVKGEWVGFRPSRPSVRCEWEPGTPRIPIFHSYGHGGSGWTTNVGAAIEAANQIEQNLRG